MFFLLYLVFPFSVDCLCGESFRWSHNFNIEDVYGMWYGAGYAQHTPDMTNKPIDIGCITLYISDASSDGHRDDWLDWSIPRKNYSDDSWLSSRNNPWSGRTMSGSWLDIHNRLRKKRSMYTEKLIRIIWDEDGQSMEQTYVYTTEDPGLWTAESWRTGEKEMAARGIDVWYPDDPPRHPDIIRVLKATPNSLIINHCSEVGDAGIFSLVLRRSPWRMDRWEWQKVQEQLFTFELPHLFRYTAVCAGCYNVGCMMSMTMVIFVLKLL